MKNRIKIMYDAQQYLFSRIPELFDIQSSGEWFLSRTEKLCALLGDPQENVHVIHVAGTSGKGSTVCAIAGLLQGCGQKVGLTTSPHLNDIRERIVIDGQMVSEEDFVSGLNDLIIASEKLSDEEQPSYFELLTVLAYYIFARKNCDYAVVETGLGGLYDATNVVRRADKVCVITDIGKDHVKILGDTYEAIAAQKAGIIQKGNAVFSLVANRAAREAIMERAREQNVSHQKHLTEKDYAEVHSGQTGTSFSTSEQLFNLQNFHSGLIGTHQARNAVLALHAVSYVCERDKLIYNKDNIIESLSSLRMPGRIDIQSIDDKTGVFDGAHNPQKMRALVASLQELFPDEKYTVIFAAKEKKDYEEMLKILLPVTEQLIVTQFGDSKQDYLAGSTSSNVLEEVAKKIGYTNIISTQSSQEAFDVALKLETDKILVTGSLHLVGQGLKIKKLSI